MPDAIPERGRRLVEEADAMMCDMYARLQQMRDSIAPAVADHDLARFGESPQVRRRVEAHPALDRALIAVEAAAAARRVVIERCAAATALGGEGVRTSADAEATWWIAQAEQALVGLRRAVSAVRRECSRALLGQATVGAAGPIVSRRAARG